MCFIILEFRCITDLFLDPQNHLLVDIQRSILSLQGLELILSDEPIRDELELEVFGTILVLELDDPLGLALLHSIYFVPLLEADYLAYHVLPMVGHS